MGLLIFSAPLQAQTTSSPSVWGFSEASSLFLRLALHVFLAAIPCLAVSAWVARKGVRDKVLLGATALATFALCGYLSFWFWFLWPRLGRGFSFLLPFAGLGTTIWVFKTLHASARLRLRALIIPTLLTAATALLILSVGFLYGGIHNPLATAATRFSHPLPIDNALPYMVSEGAVRGQIPKPLIPEWLSSDRPPLQTGIILSQIPFTVKPRDIDYQVFAVLLQSLWVFGLWLLLSAFHLDRGAFAIIFLTTLVSGNVIVNNFFVWPKLLGCAFVLGAVALIFRDQSNPLSSGQYKMTAMITGALSMFAFLSHGSTAFVLLGCAATSVLLRKLPNFRFLAAAAITAIVLYIPWMLYQKLYDPPGDRLLKWHFAGIIPVDARPFGEAVIDSYQKLGVQGWVVNKKANFQTLYGLPKEYWINIQRLFTNEKYAAADNLRGANFFYFTAALGLLPCSLLCLFAGIRKQWRSTEWKASVVLWLIVAWSLVSFSLLEFGPGTTVNHVGNNTPILLAYAASILTVWAVSHPFAYFLGTAQIILNLFLYVFFMPFHGEGLRLATLGLAMIALAATLVLTFRMGKEQVTQTANRQLNPIQ